MLLAMRRVNGALIAGWVASTVLFGHAYAAPTKKFCGTVNAVGNFIGKTAKSEGYMLAYVKPEGMARFIASMKAHNIMIEPGDIAVLMMAKTGELAVFMQNGKQACMVYDGKNVLLDDKDGNAPAGSAPEAQDKPHEPDGREWL